MKNVRQEEVLQWLCRMEEMAVQNQLKTRLLDAVRDCKKDLSRELTEQEWQAKIPEIEELLQQIKKQIPHGQEESLKEDIAQKTAEIIERCQRANEILQKEYCNGASTYVQEAERSMKELTNVRANYDDVTNRERFTNMFRNIGQKYKQQMDNFEGQYVHAVNQNYRNAFDRLKALFSATGYDKEAQRKFYQSYYENQNVLEENATAYACNVQKGESSIVEYATRMQECIQQLMKKIKKKMSWKKRIPFIALFLMIALGIGIHIVGNCIEAGSREEAIEQSGDDNVFSVLGNLFVDKIGDKIGDTIVDVGGKALFGIIVMIGIPILILLLFLYWLRTKSIDRRCRNTIIQETEKLLEYELEQWIQCRTLMTAIEESFRQIGIYVDSQYNKVIEGIMGSAEGAEQTGTGFTQLYADWENIKEKVGR